VEKIGDGLSHGHDTKPAINVTACCKAPLIGAVAHFSELLIEVNLVLSFVPNPFTTAIIASAMPAAISPYSMAVAAVSSARNLRIVSLGDKLN
jgi:hypothetical protein